MKFDISINSIESEYQLLFNYLQLTNCSNTTTNQCIYLSCIDNDPWYYSLPEMQIRLNNIRNQSSTNNRCLIKYNYSNFQAQICSLLIDQFRVSEQILSTSLSSFKTNECIDYGGQCVPDSLIATSSMQFADSNLTCSTGFICWFQGKTIFREENYVTHSFGLRILEYPSDDKTYLWTKCRTQIYF